MTSRTKTYNNTRTAQVTLSDIVSDYLALAKNKLNLIVTLTAVFGFLFAGGAKPGDVLWLFLGGYLVTASANTINQIIEKDYDALMKRTMNRPLPQGRVKVIEAWLFAGITGVLGLLVLYFAFNITAAFLGALSLLSYAFIYTPLKRIHPIAVFVGAIPGALPPLIGYVAATGQLTIEAFVLFFFQFLWQFPHFWAIAWLAFEDYQKAGYKLLPSGDKDRAVAIQSILFVIMMVVLSFVPYFLGMTGILGTIIAVVASIVYGVPAVRLSKSLDNKDARQLMFASFAYLPIVFAGLILG